MVVGEAVERLDDGWEEICATGVANVAEKVVTPSLWQQLKKTLFASQHQEASSCSSQSKIASLPAAVPSVRGLA